MKNNLLFFLLALFLLTIPLSGEEEGETEIFVEPPAEGAFTGENLSLYGYLLTFSQVNLLIENEKITDSNLGRVLYLRLKGDWNPGEHLAFHTELSYDARIGNQNPYAMYETPGISSIHQNNYPLEDFVQSFTLDHAWGMVNFWWFDLQFGKMPIAWGTGYAFNPTDRVTNPAFLDRVTEETPGTLGIAPGFSITDWLALQGYVAFQDKSHKKTASLEDGKWQNIPYGVKLNAIAGPFDLSVSWIKEVLYSAQGYQRSFYTGADFAGAVWNFGVYGEAALNLPRNEEDTGFDFEGHKLKDVLEACAGFDYSIPLLDVMARVEYFHHGRGEKSKEDYDIMKILSGEEILQGEDYFFASLERTFFNYLTLAVGGMVNLNDRSLALIPQIQYDLFGNFQVSLGATLFFGKEGSEFYGEYEIPGMEPIDFTEPGIYLKGKLSF